MPKRVKVFALVVILGSFAVSVYAGVVAAQAEHAGVAAAPTASNQFAILVTTIAGFASLLATQFFQMYRENRTRKWDLQDREQARAEMRRHAETQRLDTMQAAIELARVSNINRDHLMGAIKENTQITSEGTSKAEAAYLVASGVATDFSAKFEALHKELQSMALQPDKKEQGG